MPSAAHLPIWTDRKAHSVGALEEYEHEHDMPVPGIRLHGIVPFFFFFPLPVRAAACVVSCVGLHVGKAGRHSTAQLHYVKVLLSSRAVAAPIRQT